MKLQEYIDSKSRMKPNADIVERWKTRIVARGLSGARGAREYLRDYGKGIAAPKVIMLAKQATNEGDLLMADAFWRFAFKLEIGHEPDGEGISEVAVGKVKAEQDESCADFPANLQPGRVAPCSRWTVSCPERPTHSTQTTGASPNGTEINCLSSPLRALPGISPAS
jgi:hypothetical protein